MIATRVLLLTVLTALACSERPAAERSRAERGIAPAGDDAEAAAAMGRDTPGAARSAYAGWERRSIKALSLEDIERLLAGEGMGYALAAELNSYPGPRHVLDLADSLGLTVAQRDTVQAIRARMSAEAVAVGRAIVAAEGVLDSLFASGAIEPATLRARTAEIARLDGELRATHLEAHLETRAVLDDAQVARYDSLRGYAAPEGAIERAPAARDSAHGDHRHR